MRPFIINVLLLIFVIPCFAAVENLDEFVSRKARQNTNTFYTGETGSYYIWQPQTMSYTDVTTGNEVWKLTSTPSVSSYLHNDLAVTVWSADGNRIIYFQMMEDDLSVNTSAYTAEDGGRALFHVKSNGTYLRPVIGGAARIDSHVGWIPWDMSQRDIYYMFGRTNNGNTGVTNTHLYKNTLTDTAETRVDIITFPGSNEMAVLFGALSPDGYRILAQEYYLESGYKYYPASLSGTPALLDNDGYAIDRPHDGTYWGDTPETITTIHSKASPVYKMQDGVYWFSFMASGTHTSWRCKLTGSEADGGPGHTDDSGCELDEPNSCTENGFGECVPDNCAYTGNDPWLTGKYWSHGTKDNWGRYIAFSDTDASPISPAIEDFSDHSAKTSAFGTNGTQHQDWKAWSDWFVNTQGPTDSDYTNDRIFTAKYDTNTSTLTIVYPHTLYNNSGTYNGADYEYAALPRPGQSPDGTKILFHSTFLKTKTGDYDDKPDIYYAVAFYPNPPQITSTSATGGTVTVSFDWQLDATTRGYTTRGWPDEDVDDPPPPRETEFFRLWRSADKSTWTPRGIVKAEIFDRYNFAEGEWRHNSYWEINDIPGDGTWYYAVTSVEWSGLESRKLSNIYSIVISGGSGTGSQDTAYPSAPYGGDGNDTSAFYTSYTAANKDLIRYFNIYADDGETPSIAQTARIASIAQRACDIPVMSWVDWLGNTDGSTQYVVTAVDYQGNESTALSVSYTHKKSPATSDGQYTIEWTSPQTSTMDIGTGASGTTGTGAGISIP